MKIKLFFVALGAMGRRSLRLRLPVVGRNDRMEGPARDQDDGGSPRGGEIRLPGHHIPVSIFPLGGKENLVRPVAKFQRGVPVMQGQCGTYGQPLAGQMANKGVFLLQHGGTA